MKLFEEVNKDLNTNYNSDSEIDWNYISTNQKLSEDLIMKYRFNLDWTKITVYQKLSEAFIEKMGSYIHWDSLSFYQNLSESFIKKYKDKLNWFGISKCQKLSGKFIEQCQNKINWYNIIRYQNLIDFDYFIEKIINLKEKETCRKILKDNIYYNNRDSKNFIAYIILYEDEKMLLKDYDDFNNYIELYSFSTIENFLSNFNLSFSGIIYKVLVKDTTKIYNNIKTFEKNIKILRKIDINNPLKI